MSNTAPVENEQSAEASQHTSAAISSTCTNAVHQHARLRQLLAERLGERDDPGLGRRIRHRVGIAFLAGDRGDVDDAAVSRLDHVRRDRAAAQELAGEIDSEDPVPLLDRIVHRGDVLPGDARVVHQNVNLAQIRDCLGSGVFDGCAIGNIHFRGTLQIPDPHFGAGLLQPLDDRRADALHAAGDDRRAPLEVELVHCRIYSFTAPVMPET